MRIDVAEALAIDGVWAVITGEDVKKLSDPFLVALKTPVHQWSLAVGRVRYVGEPVALVVAESRYLAEDAAERVQVDYAPIEAVIDPVAACGKSGAAAACRGQDQRNLGAPVQLRRHQDCVRQADRTVKLTVPFPRLSFTPMECYVVVAEHNPADGSYNVLANFQGPFSTHPVMARALRVAGPKLRLRIPPDSGGSFGIKLSVFPYVVLTALAAKVTGRAGEMGRGPRRASRRRQLRTEPRHRDRGGGRRATAASSRCGSTSSRTTARSCARRCPARSTACTARSPAATTSPTST